METSWCATGRTIGCRCSSLERCLGSVWPAFLKNIINYYYYHYCMEGEMENRDGILNRTEKFNACFIRNQFA
ncbi:hypothetical protein RP20_CCG018526 [Aedes albopictus]|nr:hypothetical protein RP20_CCG018526 [Aedes albopictus]